jgi:SAM-dependent methyltransferase
MTDAFDYKRFWIGDKLKNISPRNDSLKQGDWDIGEYLKNLYEELDCESALDFGCGTGRFSVIFPVSSYVGVDLNPNAINKAKQFHSEYRFSEVNIDSPYPYADMVLAFTVFLHMDDGTLKNVLKRLGESCKKSIVLVEAIGREWRVRASVPVYNREIHEYLHLFEQIGFSMYKYEKKFNPRYAEDPKYAGKDCSTSILVFNRRH